jgi:hypothetical protein
VPKYLPFNPFDNIRIWVRAHPNITSFPIWAIGQLILTESASWIEVSDSGLAMRA